MRTARSCRTFVLICGTEDRSPAAVAPRSAGISRPFGSIGPSNARDLRPGKVLSSVHVHAQADRA